MTEIVQVTLLLSIENYEINSNRQVIDLLLWTLGAGNKF